MVARWVTPEVDALILSGQYSSGELARKFGVTRNMVISRTRTLKAQGARRKQVAWVTADADAYIQAHYNVDKTTMQIAEHLGVRQTQVASRARDLGLQKSRYYGERKTPRSARLERMAKVAARVDEAAASEPVCSELVLSVPPAPGQPYSPAPPRSSGPSLYRVGGTSPWKTCQWLDSKREKCGCQSVPGYSWCEFHYREVFQPGTGRRAA